MKIFKRCMMCNKALWRKYDTFKMKTGEGEHIVYLCTPRCWKNDYDDFPELPESIDEEDQD